MKWSSIMDFLSKNHRLSTPLGVDEHSARKTSSFPWWMNGFFVLILVAVSTVGAAIWIPLFDLDEGAFSEATREMLASGNWTSTYLNGEPRYDKPILIYWLQAISVSLFGSDTFFYRLPSIIASWAWLWVVFRFVQDFVGRQSAYLCVWFLASCCLASVIFKAAIADALLNLWICLTFFTFFRFVVHHLKTSKVNRSLMVKLGVFSGLGFLTKGPIAVLLPGAVCLCTLLFFRQFSLCGVILRQPLLWLSFLLIVVPWHVAVYLDQGMAFFEGFYLGHNLGRFSQTMENHGGSVFYYLIFFPILVLPLMGILSRHVLREAIGFERKIFCGDLSEVRILKVMLYLWFIITLLIFSFSQTQLPHYLLYGLTPVFILTSLWLLGDSSSKGSKGSKGAMVDITRIDLALAFSYLLLVSALPWLLSFSSEYVKNTYENEVISAASQFFVQSISPLNVCIFVAGSTALLMRKMAKSSRYFFILFLTILSFNSVVLPTVSAGQQKPVRLAAEYVKSQVKADQRIVSFKIDMPSFSVYSERVVPKHRPMAGDLVFTRVDRLDDLSNLNRAIHWRILFEASGILILEYGSSE